LGRRTETRSSSRRATLRPEPRARTDTSTAVPPADPPEGRAPGRREGARARPELAPARDRDARRREVRRPRDAAAVRGRHNREGHSRGRLQRQAGQDGQVAGRGVPQGDPGRLGAADPARADARARRHAGGRRAEAAGEGRRGRGEGRERRDGRRELGRGAFVVCTACSTIAVFVLIGSAQVMLIDPGQFRVINDILQKECKGRGRIETLTFAATAGS
jgi:hypothetical protein